MTAAAVGRRSGQLLKEFRSDPVGFLRCAVKSGSDRVDFSFAGRTITLLTLPHDIEEVLVRQQRSFKKGPGLLRLRPLLGDGLLTTDGPEHLASRRRLAPPFMLQKISEYASDMPAIISATINDWRGGETVDLFQEMTRVTLAVVVATLFRSAWPPDHAGVSAAISNNLDALYRPLSGGDIAASIDRTKVAKLTKQLEGLFGAHSPEPGGEDLLSLILSGAGGAQKILDEATTFLLGGHESVATALTWAWYALSQREDVRQKFEKEIDAAERHDISGQSLTYTGRIVLETLRLYPPAWMFSREAIEPVTIGGTYYPEGSILVTAPCVTHRDERYWERPDEFDPDRWEGASPGKDRPRYAYFPFGGGARRCIGEQFALTELTMALAVIGRRWRLNPPSGASQPIFDPVVTLRPAGSILMIVTAR